jgi:hypothetical protein
MPTFWRNAEPPELWRWRRHVPPTYWYLTIRQSAHRTPKENSVHGHSCHQIRGYARLGLAYSQKNYCASWYSFLPGANPGLVGTEAYTIQYDKQLSTKVNIYLGPS